MRKLVLLVGLCMLGVLTFGAVAWAQGNDISCPPGSAANAAGTTCTDMSTGEQVEPVWSYTPNPAPNTNPCPELWALNEQGVCEQVIFPPGSTATPTATATATPGPVEPLTAAPTATATATGTADATGGTAALPETGGLGALSLAALGLLIAGGLLSARLVRR